MRGSHLLPWDAADVYDVASAGFATAGAGSTRAFAGSGLGKSEREGFAPLRLIPNHVVFGPARAGDAMVFDIAAWHTVRSPHTPSHGCVEHNSVVSECVSCMVHQAMPNTSRLPRECTICTYTRPQAYAKRAAFSQGGLTAAAFGKWHQCGLLDNQRARLLGLDVA